MRAVLKMMSSSLEPIILNEVVHEVREAYLSLSKAHQVLGGSQPSPWKMRLDER